MRSGQTHASGHGAASVAQAHGGPVVGAWHGARRSAATTFASQLSEEGLLSGWMGNALVCATLPPVLAALSAADGNVSPHAKQLIIVWTTLAVALQLYAMSGYFFPQDGHPPQMWPWRKVALFCILLLAIAAYVFLALAPFM